MFLLQSRDLQNTTLGMSNKMNKKQLTEKILNHALGIIYLLTGEEYVVMKKDSPHCAAHLLTREVPIKCGDVSVYFSMEEWDYIEEHKDLYQDVMVKNHPSVSAVRAPDLQEDPDCVSSKDGAEDAGNKEDVEPPAPSTESLSEKDNGRIQLVKQVEEPLKENPEEEGIIDITDASEVEGTLEESHQEVCLEEETLQTAYASQDFQREDVTNHFSNNSYDVVNLISNSFPDEHKSFPLDGNFLPENSASWESVHIGRRKHQKQNLNSRNDYLAYQTINEDQLDELENDFSYTSCVTYHQETSTPYICNECGRSFMSAPSLEEHMKNHSVEKHHRSNECGREFEYRSGLIVHQRTHYGEKPHKCEVCGKDFNYRSRLLVHQRKHTGVKPHKCHQCGKQFDYRSHLLRHQRTHT